MAEREFVDTGIPGLNEILKDKGIPRGYTVLIAGGPGSGKTTFAIQFLHAGATLHDEPGVYVSADEAMGHLKTNMSGFGFDLDKLESEDKLAILDVSPIRYLAPGSPETRGVGGFNIGRRDFEMRRLRQEISTAVSETGAKRIDVDPVSILTLPQPDEVQRSYELIDLIQALAISGCTSLLTTELKGTSLEREHQFEEYLSQGVILLRTLIKGNQLRRVVQVTKMRGVDADVEPRPYRITETGIQVYPMEKVL
ncbi:MAG: RAD55 family ATPase [Candidatus Geothermarchaeales archaeon]